MFENDTNVAFKWYPLLTYLRPFSTLGLSKSTKAGKEATWKYLVTKGNDRFTSGFCFDMHWILQNIEGKATDVLRRLHWSASLPSFKLNCYEYEDVNEPNLFSLIYIYIYRIWFFFIIAMDFFLFFISIQTDKASPSW